MMEKIVKSCGDCPFYQSDYMPDCNHPNAEIFIAMENCLTNINPKCPEKGAFIIKTQKLEDDKS